jgi:hypothetical protein
MTLRRSNEFANHYKQVLTAYIKSKAPKDQVKKLIPNYGMAISF